MLLLWMLFVIKKNIFDPQSVESADVETVDMVGWLYWYVYELFLYQ